MRVHRVLPVRECKRIQIRGNELDVGGNADGTEELAGHRTEEGLAELAVRQAVDQVGEVPLDLDPEVASAHIFAQCQLERLDGLADALVVQIDALDRILLRRVPVPRREALGRAPRDGPKARVVMQEGLDHLLRAAHRIQRRLERRGDLTRAIAGGSRRRARRRSVAVESPRRAWRPGPQADRNCCSSVLPCSAPSEELPLVMACVTASK